MVYQTTYVSSNLADHYTISWLDPAISKLLIVFVFNTSTGITKDKFLAQRFGKGDIRPFPLKSLNLFFLRDLIAMASAFTIPPILGKYIASNWDIS